MRVSPPSNVWHEARGRGLLDDSAVPDAPTAPDAPGPTSEEGAGAARRRPRRPRPRRPPSGRDGSWRHDRWRRLAGHAARWYCPAARPSVNAVSCEDGAGRGGLRRQAPSANSASITSRFATASSGSTGSGRPSSTAAAKRSASHGVRVGRVERQRLGRGGDRRVAAGRDEDLGRAVGRDVERDLDRDPAVRAVDVDPLVGLGPRRAGERRDARRELEDAAGQHVDAERRVADDRRLDARRARRRTASATGSRCSSRCRTARRRRPRAMLRMFAGSSLKYENQLSTACSRPMRPDATSSRTATHDGWWRYMNASIRRTPASRQASTMPLGLGGGHRERLLAQDVLAGPRGRDRPVARAGGSAAGCRRRRRRGRPAAPRTTRTRARSRAGAATARARPSSRDAMRQHLAARRATEARDHLLGGDVRPWTACPSGRVAHRPSSSRPRTRPTGRPPRAPQMRGADLTRARWCMSLAHV